jgi:hypothetical protein
MLHCNSKTCTLNKNIEVTFPELKSTVCLSLINEQQKIVELNITLDEIKCKYKTLKSYFTYPINVKIQSEIICPQNEYCGWGTHCKPGYTIPNFLLLEHLPGKKDCQMIRVGSGTCLIIHRNACGFFKYWFEPDYSRIYEIRKIQSKICKPSLIINNHLKKEVSKVKFKDFIIDHINLLIDNTIFDESLIVQYPPLTKKKSVVPLEKSSVFMSIAAKTGIPVSRMIGDIQSEEPYSSKKMIFADDLVQCRYTSLSVFCKKKNSLIDNEKYLGKFKLPMIIKNHLLTYSNSENLMSTMITAPPTRLSIRFSNYSIKYFTNKVCPIFLTTIKTTGCYLCKKPAILSFTAKSTCQSGLVSITISPGMALKKIIMLTSSEQKFEIPYHSNLKCPKTKVCLVSSQEICQEINDCLSESVIHLDNEDTTVYKHDRTIISNENFISNFFWEIENLWKKIKVFFSSVSIYTLCFSVLFFCFIILFSFLTHSVLKLFFK